MGDSWKSKREIVAAEAKRRKRSPIVVGCVKTKGERRARARELYTSPLFRKRRAFAESSERPWLILSAKYGLIRPEEKIDPYDVTIPGLSKGQKRELAELVAKQAKRLLAYSDPVEVHASAPYAAILRSAGIDVDHVMKRKQIGQQLSWYKKRGF